MEKQVIHEPELVVALDVGSTYSGYAWQWKDDFKSNKRNVGFNTNWGQGAPQLHKTNTALLLKVPSSGEAEVVAFGYDAERKYSNIHSETPVKDDVDSYRLFKKFKVLLYQDPRPEEDIAKRKIEDSSGRYYPFLDVMSKFIGALRNHFLSKYGHVAKNQSKILWVVTVPTIWSEKAKQFMRTAAEKSGIAKANLLLASEPEASAIYCLSLPKEERSVMNALGEPGHKFLVVDIGGGTADLAAVEVQQDGTLKELCNEQGSCVGGQNVNEAFFHTCNDIFSGTAWQETLTRATPTELLKMEHEFERMKVTIGSDDPVDEVITLQLPREIRKKLENKEITVQTNNINIFTDSDELKFKSDYIRTELFKQSCQMLYGVIDKVLSQRLSIQTVVLVGGFSESLIVQNNVREMLKRKYADVKVEVPTAPFRAVLHGAVLFGHDPSIFYSRVSKATFGVEMNALWVENKYDKSRRWYNEHEKRYRVKHVLDIHVKRGQSVVLNGKQPSKHYVPIFPDQKQLSLPLFETQELGNNVIYTTDECCRRLATIIVDLPESDRADDRKVEVTMIYGGVQLSVEAKNCKTGRPVTTQIKFEDGKGEQNEFFTT